MQLPSLYFNKLGQKVFLITLITVLLIGGSGILAVYYTMSEYVIEKESQDLIRTISQLLDNSTRRFVASQAKLTGFSRVVEKELSSPIKSEEIQIFDRLLEKNHDGIFRNRRQEFDGHFESGIYLPAEVKQTKELKIRHFRIKKIMDIFGSAANRRMENIWYLSPERSAIIFDKNFPNFVFEQSVDNDYRNTPWLTLATPQNNPNKELHFTSAIFDPVPKVWMVSAVFPLYENGAWIGSVGEDIPLDSALSFLFSSQELFSNTQHFLVDTENNFVLAGKLQKELESSANIQKFSHDFFESNPELQKLFASKLTTQPIVLDSNFNFHGNRYVVFGAVLQHVNWRYFMVVPTDSILGAVKNQFWNLGFFIFALSVCTGSIIFIFIRKKIVKPVQSLTDKMSAYLDGKGVVSNNKDEITNAMNVFDLMKNEISNQLRDIQHLANLYQSISDNASLAIIATNTDGVITVFNKAAEHMLGFSADEMIGKQTPAVFHDAFEVQERAIQFTRELSQKVPVGFKTFVIKSDLGLKNEHEWTYISKQGIAFTVYLRVSALKDENNQIIGYLGMAADITERKKTQQQLEELSEHYRVLFSNSPDAYMLVDGLTGQIIDCNHETERLFASDRESLIKRKIYEVSPLYQPNGMTSEFLARQIIQNTLEGKQDRFEWVHQDSTGRDFCVEVSITVIMEYGKIVFYFTLRDVSDRKKAERQMQLFYTMIESTNQPFYLVDLEDNCRMFYVNQATVEHYGASREEIYSWRVPDWDPNFKYEDMPSLIQTIKENKFFNITTTHRLKSGKIIPVEVSVNYFVNADGKECTFGWIKDISKQLEMEDLHRQTLANLEATSRAKSEFLANMSHEIRTPMNAILGLSYVLEHEELDELERKSLVKKIRNSGNSLLGIINDILDFSKIESGKLELEKAPFLLSDVLERLATVMSFNSSEKQIDLIMTVASEIYDYQLIGDSLRIEQVLTNLVSNALKFTQKGYVNLEVSVLALANEFVRLRFAVQDTGIGISTDVLERIFSPFSQADTSTTRSYGGTGLGLTISQKLVNLMGSNIQVESEVGKGSTFFFEVQFDCSRFQSKKPEKILNIQIVDDNSIARAALNMTVQSLGWTPNVYDSAQSLLDSLEQYSGVSDVFLLDFQMPEMDGLELAYQLKENTKISNEDPIIIMVTGQDRNVINTHPYANVPDLLLEKPITPSSLYDAIVLTYKRHHNAFIQPDNAATVTHKSLEGYKILVVDDSEINLEVATRIFSKQGAIISTANNGIEALEWLDKNGLVIDVVLMDLQMPHLNGYEATKRIRQNPNLKNIPVIALSAGVLESQIKEALDVGVNDFITKPFNVDDAIKTIQSVVHSGGAGVFAKLSDIEAKTKQIEEIQFVKIDFEKGLEILGGEKDFYLENLKTFLNECAESMPTLSNLTPKRLEKLAHKWKGASSMLGLNGISEAAKELELSLHEDEGVNCNLMLKKLENEIIVAQKEVLTYEMNNG